MGSLAFKVALERFYLPKLIENGYAFAISVHLKRFWRSFKTKAGILNTARTTNKQTSNLKAKDRNNQINYSTLSETKSSPLKMDGWNTTFLLRCHSFRGELLVSGRVVYKRIFLVSWGAILWLAVSLQQQIHAHDHREGFRDCRCCHIQWIICMVEPFNNPL